jgi:hypothetical protein
MDSGFRGCEEIGFSNCARAMPLPGVIPAEAGIHRAANWLSADMDSGFRRNDAELTGFSWLRKQFLHILESRNDAIANACSKPATLTWSPLHRLKA